MPRCVTPCDDRESTVRDGVGVAQHDQRRRAVSIATAVRDARDSDQRRASANVATVSVAAARTLIRSRSARTCARGRSTRAPRRWSARRSTRAAWCRAARLPSVGDATHHTICVAGHAIIHGTPTAIGCRARPLIIDRRGTADASTVLCARSRPGLLPRVRRAGRTSPSASRSFSSATE